MPERHRLKKTIIVLTDDDAEVYLEKDTEVTVTDRRGNLHVTVALPCGSLETFNASWFMNNFEPVVARSVKYKPVCYTKYRSTRTCCTEFEAVRSGRKQHTINFEKL